MLHLLLLALHSTKLCIYKYIFSKMSKSVSSDSLTADKRLWTYKHPHISTLCTHADTKKTAARAQTGTETHHQLQRQGRQGLFWVIHSTLDLRWTSSSFSKLIVYQSARTHTQTSRWTTYWCHFLYQHRYSLDFSSLDRCLQRQRLAAQSAWTQTCQDHRDLIQNRFTGGAANWYNATNNSIRHFRLFWILERKKYPKHLFSVTHTWELILMHIHQARNYVFHM